MLGRRMRTVHFESLTRNGSTATRRGSDAPLNGASCISISISKDSATGVDVGFGVSGVFVSLDSLSIVLFCRDAVC